MSTAELAKVQQQRDELCRRHRLRWFECADPRCRAEAPKPKRKPVEHTLKVAQEAAEPEPEMVPEEPKPAPPTITGHLVEAARSIEGVFTPEQLAVRAWKMYPDDFGLAGYKTYYPDVHSVLWRLSVKTGPVATGLIVKLGKKLYKASAR